MSVFTCSGGIERTPAPDDAPFEIGDGAILFRPLRRRQDDVGQLRRLGQKEVGDGEKIEALETARPPPSHSAPRRSDSIR